MTLKVQSSDTSFESNLPATERGFANLDYNYAAFLLACL